MHPGELAEVEFLTATADRLRMAGHGARGALAAEAARRLGVSVQTLYTRLRKVGFSSGKRLRSDKGDARITEQEIRDVAAMLGNRRAQGKRIAVVGDAIDIARANGKLSAPISTTTALRLMRLHHCHPAQIDKATPHQPLRTLYPNQLWQLDPSLCVLYYLPQRGSGLQVMDERSFNARKPVALARTLKERVLRYVVTDHYSGAIHLRYVMAPGETQEGLFEVLVEAMTQRDGFVVHGVPEQIVWDAGSANMAHGVQNLLRSLGVRQWPHMPGNPRAKGQVECANNIIERRFEARLAFMRVDDLGQLNAAADAWSRDFNSTQVHRRHSHTRWALWSSRAGGHIRLCPPRAVCETLLTSRPEPRKVNGELTISFKPRGFERADYCVAHIPNVHNGDELQVIVSPYAAPNIYVVVRDKENAERFIECAPRVRDDVGFYADAPVPGEQYARPADTVVDASRKDISQRLWGSVERDAADKARKQGRVAMDGAINPMADIEQRASDLPQHIRRPGSELHLPNKAYVEELPKSIVDLAGDLRYARGTGFTAIEHERVNTLYPDAIPADIYPALLAQLVRGELPALPGESPIAAPPRLYAVR